jgi:hypothetical protein
MFGKLVLALAATSLVGVSAAPVEVEKRTSHTGQVSFYTSFSTHTITR